MSRFAYPSAAISTLEEALAATSSLTWPSIAFARAELERYNANRLLWPRDRRPRPDSQDLFALDPRVIGFLLQTRDHLVTSTKDSNTRRALLERIDGVARAIQTTWLDRLLGQLSLVRQAWSAHGEHDRCRSGVEEVSTNLAVFATGRGWGVQRFDAYPSCFFGFTFTRTLEQVSTRTASAKHRKQYGTLALPVLVARRIAITLGLSRCGVECFILAGVRLFPEQFRTLQLDPLRIAAELEYLEDPAQCAMSPSPLKTRSMELTGELQRAIASTPGKGYFGVIQQLFVPPLHHPAMRLLWNLGCVSNPAEVLAALGESAE